MDFNSQRADRLNEITAPWAMVGNVRQHWWQAWRPWQFRICKLQIPLAACGFESHPLRHN